MIKIKVLFLFFPGLLLCGVSSFAQSSVHVIGEKFGGGIIFYISDNGQHGLIAAPSDQNGGIVWYNGLTRYTGANADGVDSGLKNTLQIVSKLKPDDPSGQFAARTCREYKSEMDSSIYSDWYLPSKFELNLLYQQKEVVGGFAQTNYWSSTEYKTNSVWIQYFGNGGQHVSNSESYANAVRAIRAF
jgi:hypothetical protein